jgi:hypothetical protein
MRLIRQLSEVVFLVMLRYVATRVIPCSIMNQRLLPLASHESVLVWVLTTGENYRDFPDRAAIKYIEIRKVRTFADLTLIGARIKAIRIGEADCPPPQY